VDGRFLVRSQAGSEPEHILVLKTLGAPERRRFRDRRGRRLEEAEPEPVPTTRVTVVRARPFDSAEEAAAWLEAVQRGSEREQEELDAALRALNGAIRAHRAAAADPYARDVSAAQALVVRIGYGAGEEVADGNYRDAWEPPRARARTKRSMEAPDERFAALLGGRAELLAGEELVLRARADLDAGRPREAALQARMALEALLAELPDRTGERKAELEADRGALGEAAGAALRGDPPASSQLQVEEAVKRMEAALRRIRLGG
jgi:hypothetical protein